MDLDVAALLTDQTTVPLRGFPLSYSLPQTQNYPKFSRELSVIKERKTICVSGLCLYSLRFVGLVGPSSRFNEMSLSGL
jgi:hypothetical protein